MRYVDSIDQNLVIACLGPYTIIRGRFHRTSWPMTKHLFGYVTHIAAPREAPKLVRPHQHSLLLYRNTPVIAIAYSLC
jgi:hypothetical protein